MASYSALTALALTRLPPGRSSVLAFSTPVWVVPLSLWCEGPLPSLNIRGLAAITYVGLLATAFAYWAVVEVGRYVRATTISVTLLAVPSVGLLISALTFHEDITVSLGLGIALVSAGVLLTTTEMSWERPSRAAVERRSTASTRTTATSST